MKCNMKCPECKEIHEVNSRYCVSCGFDLEPYIISYKDKHLPVHFDGGALDAGDTCECCGDCCCDCCTSDKKRDEPQGCCENFLDCL